MIFQWEMNSSIIIKAGIQLEVIACRECVKHHLLKTWSGLMEWKNKRCSLLKMVIIDKLCPSNIPSKPGWMDGYKVRLTSVTFVICGKVKKKTMPERRRGNCQIEETRIILEVSIDNFFDSKVLRTVMHRNPFDENCQKQMKCLSLKKEKLIMNFNNKHLFHEIYYFLHMILLIKSISVVRRTPKASVFCCLMSCSCLAEAHISESVISNSYSDTTLSSNFSKWEYKWLVKTSSGGSSLLIYPHWVK